MFDTHSMSVYDKSLITMLALAVVFVLVSIPLILRKVPRNVLYGFRTPSTLRDDAIWYPANAHGGWGLLISALIGGILEMALYRLRPLPDDLVIPATLGALLIPTFIAMIATMIYIGKLARR